MKINEKIMQLASNIPSNLPSNLASNLASSLASNLASSLPSNLPSNLLSNPSYLFVWPWRSLTIPVLSRRRENTASLACRFFSQHWVTLTMSAASGPLCSFSSKQRSASSSRIRNGTCDAFRRSTSVYKHQAAWLVSAFNLWFPTPYARRGSLSLSLIIYIHL